MHDLRRKDPKIIETAGKWSEKRLSKSMRIVTSP